MDQLDNDPVVQGDLHAGVTFEEAKLQFLGFWEQIAGRENYICIEASI